MSLASALRPADGKPWILLSTPAFESVAAELAAMVKPGTIERCPVLWGRFPDNTPRLAVDAEHVRGRDVLLLAEIDTCDVLSYFGVVYAVPRYFARTFTVISPFFPTGTMERVESEGEVATAMTLARMLSATPQPSIGTTCFMFFDIHALATRFFFSDTVRPLLTSAVPLLLERLAARDTTTVSIAFPDDGAKKRFARFFPQFDVCVCAKTRVGDTRTISLTEGAPKDRHVVIVDDMVQSGGTMLECVRVLQREGAASVSCFVTHAVFPRDSHVKFLPNNMKAAGLQPLEEFLLTNSNPGVAAKLTGMDPFRVLSIAPRLAELLEEP